MAFRSPNVTYRVFPFGDKASAVGVELPATFVTLVAQQNRAHDEVGGRVNHRHGIAASLATYTSDCAV